jgi:hypothetical protein
MPIIAGRASAAYGAGFAAVTTVPYAGPFGAYDALASITLVATTNSITFAGIPVGYKHLQIREQGMQTRVDYALSQSSYNFNGDTSAVYTNHYAQGDGSTVTVGYDITSGYMWTIPGTEAADFNGANTKIFGGKVTEILDYSSVSKFKTVRMLAGVDFNGTLGGLGGRVGFGSGSWRSLSPITSITINSQSAPYKAGSKFSLYGVK